MAVQREIEMNLSHFLDSWPRRLVLVIVLVLAPSAATGAPEAAVAGHREVVAAIDAETRGMWQRSRVTPAPVVDDAGYIRRVTLDLIGRIPTTDEVQAFVADSGTDKRAHLVDRLLASEEHAAWWAELYLDTLVGREARVHPRGQAARDYLREAFRTGRGFDEVASDVLTATGSLESGAVGYVVAHRMGGGDVATLAGKTAQVFLGASIQCAQCHDDPGGRFSREDFTRFAAYFNDVGARRVSGSEAVLIDRARPGYSPPRRVVELRRARNPYIVEPRFFGTATPPQPGETRRQVLARTIVASPRFAQVTVNRTWAHMFGRPIVAPLHDLGGLADRQPPLLARLAADFAASGFDQRRLLAAIALSEAYQRDSIGGASADDDPDLIERVFARAAVRPLTGGQLFASHMLVSGIDQGAVGGWQQRRVAGEERRHLRTFDGEDPTDVERFTGTVPRALLLRNGPLTNQGARARPGFTLGAILDRWADDTARIEQLFWLAYARSPRPDEEARFLAYLEARGPARRERLLAYEDLLHALITSTEFTTNH